MAGEAESGRGSILQAATKLFAERGFNGVGVREIAAAAGVNISMISYHFGGKEGLYAEILKAQFEPLEKVVRNPAPGQDPLQNLENYARATVARYRRNPHLLRFYSSELTNPTASFGTIVKPAIQGVVRLLRETFAEGVAQGIFRDDVDATDAALALAGMINFSFLLEPATAELVDHSAKRDEELIAHIMEIFKRGVLA